MKKRESNGNGSIYTRGNAYYLRYKDEVSGKYTSIAMKVNGDDGTLRNCISEKEARAAARDYIEKSREVSRLKSKETAIAEIARTRRMIAALEHNISDLWELFKKSSFYNDDNSAGRNRALRLVTESFLSYCSKNGILTADRITEDVITAWLNRTCAGLSNRTYNEYLNNLKQILQAAYKDLGLERNPSENLKARPRHSISREAFTLSQIEKIIDCFDKGFFSRCHYRVPCGEDHHLETREMMRPYEPKYLDELKIAFFFGVFAGCRLKDAVTMRWKEIDLQKKTIRYQPDKTARSSGVVVTVPIVDRRLYDALLKRERTSEFVTPNLSEWHKRNNTTLAITYRRLFEAACPEISTDDDYSGRRLKPSTHGFHALRHTFVSVCANAGVSQEICASIVGHSTVQTTKIYTHITDETKRREMQKAFRAEGKEDILEGATQEQLEAIMKILGKK